MVENEEIAVEAKRFFVYILRSGVDGTYYVGQTRNVNRRLIEHNSKQVLSTKGKSPWKLVHTEEYGSRSEAVRREREIKGHKKRKYIESLLISSTERGAAR